MNYTKEKEHLDELYDLSNLDLNYKDILEIPTFLHNGCRISVSYLPKNNDTNESIMAVKIRTNNNVTFTPFYLKPCENSEFEFIAFFDNPEYEAIKESIIFKDNNSTIPLFKDISHHILNCTISDVIKQNTDIWLTYQRQRTVFPHPANDNILPMTIKNVRIGELSKKRIRRIFPVSEANKIINILYKNNKTIVFTTDPTKARNIYALLSANQIFIEQ